MAIAEKARRIPDVDYAPKKKAAELARAPVKMESGDWVLQVVPWIGGRLTSMTHAPSGKFP